MSLRGYYHILYHFTHVLCLCLLKTRRFIQCMQSPMFWFVLVSLIILYRTQGPVSMSEGTSFRGISWSLGAARFVFGIVRSLWDLTGTSAAVLPMCLSIAVRYDDLGCRSRGFEALRGLAEGRLFGCWDGALVTCCLFLWCRVEPTSTEPRCWRSDPPGWVKWVQSPNQTRNGPEHGDVNKL